MSKMRVMLIFLALHCTSHKYAECSCDGVPFSAGKYTYHIFKFVECFYCAMRIRSCNATFDEAEERCRKMNGHLVSIHNEEENVIVHRMSEIFQNYTSYDHFTWIGLRRKSPGDRWEWTDGTPVDFTKWSDPPEPNNYKNLGENCAQLYTGQLSTWQPNTRDYEWNDVECGRKMLFFVCKIKKQQKPLKGI